MYNCSAVIPHPLSAVFAVVAPREIFFEPDVEADEEVAAAHFFDLELGGPVAAVAPGDRDDGKTVSAHDGFEGEFDRDVEVRGKDRPHAVNDGLPVGLEGIGRVVEPVVEKDTHEGVRQAVHDEFYGRVINRLPPFDKPASKNAVVSLVEFLPIPEDIFAIIGIVGHHDDNSIAGHGVESSRDCAPDPVRPGVFEGA